ncbi:MAG: prepilin-type N-terminal cleavage/methylation domain-containing protein [Planctomycetota bacterium]
MSSLGTRKGLTLLEVLITIFVMGIGMLSVLTLFPLAARKIGMSIDMDRATQMAGNASAFLSLPVSAGKPSIRQTIQQYFEFKENQARTAAAGNPALLVNLSRPSEIVHFDPAGAAANQSTALLGTIAPMNAGVWAPPSGWPSLGRNQVVSLDEYPFTDQGAPEPNSRRSERYSSSYLFRRSRLDDETSMETLILVYAGRPYDFGVGMETDLSTMLTNGVNTAGTSELGFNTLPTQGPGGPDRVFHRGSWIMDRNNWKTFYQVISVDAVTKKVAIDRPLAYDLTNAIWIDYMIDWFDRGSAP